MRAVPWQSNRVHLRYPFQAYSPTCYSYRRNKAYAAPTNQYYFLTVLTLLPPKERDTGE